jgi:hypothetical protein
MHLSFNLFVIIISPFNKFYIVALICRRERGKHMFENWCELWERHCESDPNKMLYFVDEVGIIDNTIHPCLL